MWMWAEDISATNSGCGAHKLVHRTLALDSLLLPNALGNLDCQDFKTIRSQSLAKMNPLFCMYPLLTINIDLLNLPYTHVRCMK